MNSLQKVLRSQVYVAVLLLAFNYNASYAIPGYDENIPKDIVEEAEFIRGILSSLCLPKDYETGYKTVINEEPVEVGSSDYSNIYGYFCNNSLNTRDFNEDASVVDIFGKNLIEKGIIMNQDAKQEREKLEYLTSSWAQKEHTRPELRKAVQDLIDGHNLILGRNRLFAEWILKSISHNCDGWVKGKMDLNYHSNLNRRFDEARRTGNNNVRETSKNNPGYVPQECCPGKDLSCVEQDDRLRALSGVFYQEWEEKEKEEHHPKVMKMKEALSKDDL